MADWLYLWNQKANTENYFTQTGRGNSFTMYQFLLYIQDVNNALNLCKTDRLLDIGGGPGWVAMHLSPFVDSIIMTDFSVEMVERARGQVRAFGNIKILQQDIIDIQKLTGLKIMQGVNKYLIGSVLQYLNKEDIIKVMQGLYYTMEYGNICLFTHNPDLHKRPFHLATVPPESMQMEVDRLWFDPDEIYDIAMDIGFRICKILPINPLIWQSGHMFDMVLTK